MKEEVKMEKEEFQINHVGKYNEIDIFDTK